MLETEKERWSKELLPFILFCVVGGDYDKSMLARFRELPKKMKPYPK